MILWGFSGIAILAAVVAAFVSDIRRAVLALWICGLSVGAVYVTLGAELLGITQWIISTLVAISFVFFSVMFGEYGATEEHVGKKGIMSWALAVIAGVVFTLIIWLGTRELLPVENGPPKEGTDLVAIGKNLTENHLISLEVLALTLFLVLVGAGVVARPETERTEQS